MQFNGITNFPGKFLWFFHRKTQTFLASCASAINFINVDFSMLQWDMALDNSTQGIGNITNMMPPSFLLSSYSVNNKGTNTNKRNSSNGNNNKGNFDPNVMPTKNTRVCSLFQDETNCKRLLKHACENKDYPPK